jgi:hypothetical protein
MHLLQPLRALMEELLPLVALFCDFLFILFGESGLGLFVLFYLVLQPLLVHLDLPFV